MRRSTAATALALVASMVACSGGDPGSGEPASTTDSGPGVSSGDAGNAASADGASRDTGFAPTDAGDAANDADSATACSWSGAPGQCIAVSACAALAGHTSFPGECPGPADIECCIDTPDPADNPPIPAGYVLMQQSQVTPNMTTWAVAILDDPATYPMFSTTTKTFGSLMVLARVEWHPPDFQNSVVHRGVTLYEPG
jgi:hypothetical protein